MEIKTKKITLEKLFSQLAAKAGKGEIKMTETRKQFEEAEKDGVYDEYYQRTAGSMTQASGGMVPMRTQGPRVKFFNEKDEGRGFEFGGTGPEARFSAYKAALMFNPGDDMLPQLGDAADERLHKRFQKLHDGLVMCALVIPGFRPDQSHHWKSYCNLQRQVVDKILTTQSGGSGSSTGGDFIPNLLSSQLQELFRQKLFVAATIDHIPMPKSPFTLPIEGADILPYLLSEGSTEDLGTHSSDSISTRTPATADVTFTAIKLGAMVVLSAEADEDSVIAMAEYARKKLIQAPAYGVEDAIINGDDTSVYQDTNDVAGNAITSTHHLRSWQGLRALALASSTTYDMGNIQLTTAAILNIKTQFGKYAQVPSESTVLVSPIGNTHLVHDTNVRTLQNYGGQATILTGELGNVYGMPIVQSGNIPENLNASGQNDDSTTDRGCVVVFHRPSFALGDRRAITVKSAEDIITDKVNVVVTWRGDFQRVNAEITTPEARNAGMVYNIANGASIS